MAYLPKCLWGACDLNEKYRDFLNGAVTDLASNAGVLKRLLTVIDMAGQRREPRPKLDGCDYYLFSNMLNGDDEERASSFSNSARILFDQILGVPEVDQPRFGIATPATISANTPIEFESFVESLLNEPSSYYLIAREGEVAVAPVSERGSYAASNSLKCIDPPTTAAWTSITDTLPCDKYVDARCISDFLSLIRQPRTKEAEIQRFLEENPGFFTALNNEYFEIQPHVCLYDPDEGRLIPDFIARLNEPHVWDVIELKLPVHSKTINTRNGMKPSAAMARGIAELLKYRDFFASKGNRKRVMERFGTAPYEPALVLVIGNGEATTKYQWKSVRAGFPKVDIVTYDYLLEWAKCCRASLRPDMSPD